MLNFYFQTHAGNIKLHESLCFHKPVSRHLIFFFSYRTAQAQICASSVIQTQQYILTLCDTGQNRLLMTDPVAVAFTLSALITYFINLIYSLVDRKGTFSCFKKNLLVSMSSLEDQTILFPVNKLDALNGRRQQSPSFQYYLASYFSLWHQSH